MTIQATLAFLAFFPFAFAIFKRQPPAVATAVVVLAGSLFLPELVSLPNLPLLPAIEKERLTYLAAFVAIFAYHPKRLFAGRPGPELLFFGMILGSLGAITVNTRPIFNEVTMEPAIGLHWLAAQCLDDFLTFILPFVVGRTMFRSVDDLKTLLYLVAAAGLVYTALIVVEIGMSIPWVVFQLSDAIYNVPVRPTWRWGIIQPVVFMENGLAVASFMAVAALCAGGLIEAKEEPVWRGIKRGRAVLLAGLLMTWNVAGNIFGYTLAALMWLLKRKTFALLAMLPAVFSCLYPALRMVGWFPDQKILDIAYGIDAERAFSLYGRFAEEYFIIDTIGERFWFGWGTFDRIPGAISFGSGGETGLDSFFVIRTGMTGIFGLEMVFLLLAIPVIVAWRRCRAQTDDRIVVMVAALMACVSIRMLDLLLNGLWNTFPFFLAGALSGVTASLVPHASAVVAARRGKAVNHHPRRAPARVARKGS